MPLSDVLIVPPYLLKISELIYTPRPNPGKIFSLASERSIRIIEAGKFADLVVVGDEPLTDCNFFWKNYFYNEK